MPRVTAIVLNVVVPLFTAAVVLAEGMAANPWYVALTWFLLLAPLLTAWTLWRLRVPGALPDRARWFVAGLNVVMLLLIIAAIVDQHPHPDEPGFLPYVLVVCVTPAVSAWAVLR